MKKNEEDSERPRRDTRQRQNESGSEKRTNNNQPEDMQRICNG